MTLKRGDKVRVGGKTYRITKPTAKGKKKKAIPVSGKGKSYHFGQAGVKISPGTKRGDNYCARSSGIKSKKVSPNAFARIDWHCQGKKSKKKK